MPVAVPAAPRPARRWPRALGLTALVIAVGLVGFYAFVMGATRIEPPVAPAVTRPPLVARGARAYVGPNYMTRERGLWELHLEGDPWSAGYAHARLGSRLLMETEDYMFREMNRYVPSRIAMFLIRLGVRWQYRHLADDVPRDYALEIAGQAAAAFDGHSDFLPIYHRMIFYHALHDITQALEHSPLLGCTAFAASGKATTNGHLIVGRNFDFEGPEPFDRDKAVLFFKPSGPGKIPFASVAWTGMTGAVTGLNAEKIYVSINAARTDDTDKVKDKRGIPVELLVREVLESARSIDDVVRLVKEHRVMVPDFYLVGDGKTGEAVVIERSPSRMEVRRATDAEAPMVPLANHALTPAFAGDVKNDHLKRYLTSGARFRRLVELLDGAKGQIDPARALAILRDKKGEGGVPLGLGNRNALDAIIATHSVVVDATDLTIWVGTGPHLLGRYVGYDLRKELLGENRPDPADLPADDIVGTPALRAYEQAVAELRVAEALVDKDPGHAIDSAEKAVALEPDMPEAHKILADLLRARGDKARARDEYQKFLALHPPYLADIERVQSVLQSL